MGSCSVKLEPNDGKRLAILCGELDSHIKQIESHFKVDMLCRGNLFVIRGDKQPIQCAKSALIALYSETKSQSFLSDEQVFLCLRQIDDLTFRPSDDNNQVDFSIHTPFKSIVPRGHHQQSYVKNIRQYDVNLALGPAGTGKTYLAVALAVEALQAQWVSRIILVRPAVEAGERLGFLPGDLAEKIDPYLRPLYDALYEMLGFEKVSKLVRQQKIELAPLAYMRGRTLNQAFIILDEGQNTTKEQMKMFLTRIGFGSKAVITGDATQIDLPKGVPSGLLQAKEVLSEIDEVGMIEFSAKDVVRHKLVQRIVEVYDRLSKPKARLK